MNKYYCPACMEKFRNKETCVVHISHEHVYTRDEALKVVGKIKRFQT